MAHLYPWLLAAMALAALAIPRHAVIVALIAVAMPVGRAVGGLVTARLASYLPA